MNQLSKYLPIILLGFILGSCNHPSSSPEIRFEVAMPDPASHTFQVTMDYSGQDSVVTFKMPTWTPGYYQKLDYAAHLQNLKITTADGSELPYDHPNETTWQVSLSSPMPLHLSYSILTDRPFVATPYLDEHRAYIIPGALFLYIPGQLDQQVIVKVHPLPTWPDIATGLSAAPHDPETFIASDYDVLYDSPILIGKLSSFPAFEVNGISHYFTGYQMENIPGDTLMQSLQKIVKTATHMIGDIPYDHYTFIGIGEGRGGIEHLNSTSVSFSKANLATHQSTLKTLFFLAHEYFHHYNVKRIRPYELGPFDYEEGSKTRQLWISEGLSVYYEYLLVKRAGLCSEEELLEAFRKNIQAFEYESGKEFQTLAESSYNTWSDGPFGEGNYAFNRTISYYEKGPVVGLLLDFKIRTSTNNKKSLDDVMKALYDRYYMAKNRGFTEAEFKKTCEETTGVPIDDILDYVYTTKPLDYTTYPQAFGYRIDTVKQEVAGGWLGITRTSVKNDTLVVAEVEWKSPAWEAGIRKGQIILNGSIKPEEIQNVLKDHSAGEQLSFSILEENSPRVVSVRLDKKKNAPYTIGRIAAPSEEQSKMIRDWLGE